MNCANHPDAAVVAYCRTCGKALCSNCTRDVKGVIYCENCLADRLQGVQPAQATGGAVVPPPIVPTSGPNPTVAGILAGFFPFGVGAVYCGQYAKGLGHLVVFTLLVWGESVINNDGINAALGVGIAFFYVWQIIDAVRTAKALQMGQPAPDPMGLGQAFGAGDKVDTSRIPTVAVILIGLGVLFLLQTLGIFEFNADRIWPIFLIGLGIWLGVRRLGANRSAQCCQVRGMVGPVVLVTIGVLSLIENLGGMPWHRTWPVLLLAIGITKLLERRSPTLPPPMPPGGMGSSGSSMGDVQAPASEVRNG
jgi:hypothetical protein